MRYQCVIFSLKINTHLLWTLSKELGIIKVMCTNKIVEIASLTKYFWSYFTKEQYYWDSTVLLKIEQYNFKKQQFVLVTSRNSVELSGFYDFVWTCVYVYVNLKVS